MISKTVEYALRASVYVAEHGPEPQPTRRVAIGAHVPPAYLAKILSELKRHGVMASRRGTGGGVSLRKSPDQVSLLDIVSAVEPIDRIRSCPLAISHGTTQLCPLHSRLDRAYALVEDAFRGSTLADLVGRPATKKRSCPFPRTGNSVATKN